jgi:PEP-CTERM motif
VYTDNNGMPGTLIGPLTLFGPIGIFYAGRMNNSELGTFSSSMTELDLTGTFNGLMTHSIEIILNPTMTTSGPTTVSELASQFPDGEFRVSSFFDVFAEISLDHGAFMPGPERTFTLTPEPGSISLLALGLLGVAGELRRRLRK